MSDTRSESWLGPDDGASASAMVPSGDMRSCTLRPSNLFWASSVRPRARGSVVVRRTESVTARTTVPLAALLSTIAREKMRIVVMIDDVVVSPPGPRRLPLSSVCWSSRRWSVSPTRGRISSTTPCPDALRATPSRAATSSGTRARRRRAEKVIDAVRIRMDRRWERLGLASRQPA